MVLQQIVSHDQIKTAVSGQTRNCGQLFIVITLLNYFTRSLCIRGL
jgi:hypothetical protein